MSPAFFAKTGAVFIKKEGGQSDEFLGNVIWFVFGGLIGAISWFLAGCLWCITIIGIPIGLQCFKFATLSLHHLGKTSFTVAVACP